jgi:hypothetical protein
MPAIDKTGPAGQGEMTGRGLGFCKIQKKEDIARLGKGMGKRRKSGSGDGRGKRLKYMLK